MAATHLLYKPDKYPARFMAWQSQGLSPRAASALSLAGCDDIAQVTALGRQYFEQQPNVGAKTLAELAQLADWPASRQTAVDAIAAALALSVDDHRETRCIAQDVMIALRRSGFVVSTSSAPAGRR